MSLSEVVQKLVKVVNNLVDEVGDIEDKTGVYDDKIAALESKSADQAVYNDHINREIEEINNTISELPTYDIIADIRTDINNINSSVADLDTRVTVLEGQNIYQRLDAAEQNIANLGNDIKSINGDITNIENNISDIKSDMRGVKNRLDNLEDCCTDVQGDITTINEDMSDMLDDISGLQTAVSGKSSVSVRIPRVRTDSLVVITVDGTDYNITAQNGNNIWLYDPLDSSHYDDLPHILSADVNYLKSQIDGCVSYGYYRDDMKRIFLDYEKESGEFVDYDISGSLSFSGYLTTGRREVYILIPFNKFLLFPDSSYSYTINATIAIRCIDGYLHDSGNTYQFNNINIANFNPIVSKYEAGFRIKLTLPTQPTAANNTPLSCTFIGSSKIRITVL